MHDNRFPMNDVQPFSPPRSARSVGNNLGNPSQCGGVSTGPAPRMSSPPQARDRERYAGDPLPPSLHLNLRLEILEALGFLVPPLLLDSTV